MAKTGRDQHLKLRTQSHILFFDKKHSKPPPGKYPWQDFFKSPRHSVFSDLHPFQNLGLKVVPLIRKGGGVGWYCVYIYIHNIYIYMYVLHTYFYILYTYIAMLINSIQNADIFSGIQFFWCHSFTAFKQSKSNVS